MSVLWGNLAVFGIVMWLLDVVERLGVAVAIYLPTVWCAVWVWRTARKDWQELTRGKVKTHESR